MKVLKVVQIFFLLLFISACKTGDNTPTSKTKITPKVESQIPDPNLFFQAALEGNIQGVEHAIQAGININIPESGNRTALMLAAFNGHSEIVHLLIENAANVNLADENNRTALMFAASGPFSRTVELLLEAGADPNVTDNHENWTALMFAAAEGHLKNVQLLHEAGADAKLKDSDGETAYDFAVSLNHNEVAEYLNNIK